MKTRWEFGLVDFVERRRNRGRLSSYLYRVVRFVELIRRRKKGSNHRTLKTGWESRQEPCQRLRSPPGVVVLLFSYGAGFRYGHASVLPAARRHPFSALCDY